MQLKPIFSYTQSASAQAKTTQAPSSGLSLENTAAELINRNPATDQEQKITPALQIHLSEEGLFKAAEEDKNKDIDESNLPEVIKDLLKRIRELKELLQEVSQKIQEVAHDLQLTDEERAAELKALQAEMGSLDKALRDVMNTLNQTMRELKFDEAQKTEVSSLLWA